MASSITFAMIKPESFSHPFVCWSIVSRIIDSGLSVLAAKVCRVPRSQAENFYHVHKDRFFYGRLVSHMNSGPIMALLLGGPQAVERWRLLLGPTKVSKTVIENRSSLRGRYGLSDTRNVGHGSDSLLNAVSEANFFFPELCDLNSMSFREESIRQRTALDRRELFRLIFNDSLTYDHHHVDDDALIT